LTFADTGDSAALDKVVLGVLQFYLAKKPKESLDVLPGTTRLVDDLGCDSLTMMDMVFMVESLFDIKIDDAELMQIATLDDLRDRLRRHVKGTIPSVG
jgi:3-hydroxyacyl-[acyl-carrier-protein] dehydratase